MKGKRQPPEYRRLSFFISQTLLGDGILERLANLERGNAGRGDRDLFLRSGVAANASGTLLELERAKADELNLVALDERLGDGFENGVDTAFSLSFLEAPVFSATAAASSALFMFIPPV